MRRTRNTTPYLLNAKYPAKCPCGVDIKAGDEALYYPASRSLECRKCATRTLEALADEQMMGGGY
jgi:hypothetical protein